MVLGSEVDAPAVRFGLYIDELQEFFAGRGLQFGSPQDIFPLADRLSGASFFRDEMSSMIRAIIYREAEGISREELLEIVAVAVSGPHIDISAAQFRAPVRHIVEFLSKALRSLWMSFPDELAGGESVDPEMKPSAPEPVATTPVAPAIALAAAEAPGNAAAAAIPLAEREIETHPDPEILSRARAALERAAHPDPQLVAAPMVAPAPRVRAQASASAKSMWRNYFWLAGICGILLGLVTGLLVRDRGPLLSAPVLDGVQSTEAAAPSIVAPKPTPYELPIRDTRPVAPAPLTATAAPPPIRPVQHTPAPWLRQAEPVRRSKAFTPVPQTRVEAQSQLPRYASTAQAATPRLIPGDPIPAPEPSVPVPSSIPRAPLPPPAPPAHAYSQPNVFLASSGVMTSNLLFAPAPEYPSQTSAAGVEGRVVLEALIWRDGTVVATHILRGDRTLGAAASEAVRHWRYRPYMADGRASDVGTVITVDFRLQH